MALCTYSMAKDTSRRTVEHFVGTPPVTIPIAFVAGMISGLQAHGEFCHRFLAETGIAPGLLLEPGARVTADQYAALFRLLIEAFDDECLGFLSRPARRGSFALLLRSALDARDFETAIRRIAQVFRLLQDDFRLELLRDGRLAGLELRSCSDSGSALPFLHELLIRTFWRSLAWLAGGRLRVTRFDFAFPIPTYAANYGKVFPAALQFGCAASAFWFDAELLSGAVRRDRKALHAFLADAQTEITVPKRDDTLCSARVRGHLQMTQPEWPDLAAMAAALHISTSTLQRHLAVEGLSYQTLKDELRRDIAIVRLHTSTVTLTALALGLGFRDDSSFQRAFKNWTGSAPGAYRGARKTSKRPSAPSSR